MRLLVLAVGSQGDVRPFAALGAGLAGHGHSVTIATHEAFREVARTAGLGFSIVRGNPMDIVQGEAGQAWLASMDHPARFLRTTSRIAAGILDTLNDDALAAARDCDALIYSLPLSLSGHTIAEARGIPGIPAALYPLHPTRAFPSILTPGLPPLGGLANRVSAAAVVQAFWLMFRQHQNRWRRQRAGLPRLALRPPLAALARRRVPVLYGFSPSLIPVPSDWRRTARVCGYWFLDSPPGWEPPADLLSFLGRGPAPVYVGFGSMASSDPGRMADIVLEALARAGQRAILASGWGGLRQAHLPSTVMAVDYVPHDWLFTRVSAAVHHGGAGTTAAALRAGIPSAIVPFFADPFFWGRRLHAMGLSPQPIPRSALSSLRLARAVIRLGSDAGMRARCRSAGEAIRAERGVAVAAETVDRYLRSVIPARIH